MSLFQQIIFPKTSSYSSDSDHIPLEFYEQAFPKSKTIDMVLGYFSTNAIRTLCISFAEFIFNGGKMRIITNHLLSEEDKENLIVNTSITNENRVIDIFQDIEILRQELGPYGFYFFDCLKYLLSQKRLEIQPVMHKPNALAHYKKIIFFDGENHLYINGSANFTYSGIIRNGESFNVDKSWGDESQQIRIDSEIKNFEKIFSKQHESFEYLIADKVTGVINSVGEDLSGVELIEKAKALLNDNNVSDKVKKIYKRRQAEFEDKVEKLKMEPNFPYGSTPREYQKEAYNNWIQKGYQGIFAMATGTGKTITSLNCLLQEYLKNKDKTYHALIIVPTISLVNQWADEAKLFNFNGIIKVSSRNKWETELSTMLSISRRIPVSFIIITTYASFIKDKFFKCLNKFPVDTLLIADEAHNIGSPSVLEKIKDFPLKKRIGLSATPKRAYDLEGSIGMEYFFKDTEPYTYSFSMERAISEGILCKYYYHPHIVNLTSDELEAYIDISKKLAKMYNSDTQQFNSPEIAQKLLLKRKRIIHKAENKLSKTISILKSRFNKEGSIKYTFIYVPEGKTEDDTDQEEIYEELDKVDTIKIINQYTRAIGNISPSVRVNQFVSGMKDRDDILQQFKEGKIHVIASMKCLDEGIDIPRAEHAIFCSSTGNPRQFIQRRGRILRKHLDKDIAIIHDLVVIPDLTCSSKSSETYNLERNMVQKELERVMYFASLAINPFETETTFSEICEHYYLNIYTIHQNLNT